MDIYLNRLEEAKREIERAEYILIGGGAGLSAAAGITYGGKRFTDNFADFIEKYGFEDMYSPMFYKFKTQEEHWAHLARHIDLNRFLEPPAELYKRLFELVKDKNYFVITTNVESQFEKSGFDKERIFEVQGNYGKLQCAKGCHNKLYPDEELIKAMAAQTKDCRVPTCLVPKCPVCGGEMYPNLRKDNYFVQDEDWYAASGRYGKWLSGANPKKTVLLELGVGFNTPAIIRFPFEKMAYRGEAAKLIRINSGAPEAMRGNENNVISFDENMSDVIEWFLGSDMNEQNRNGNKADKYTA